MLYFMSLTFFLIYFHVLASWSSFIGYLILQLALGCATTIATKRLPMVAGTRRVGVQEKKRRGWWNGHQERGLSVGGWCPREKSREVFSKHNSSGVSSLVVKAAARDPPKLQDICLGASFLALWARRRSSLWALFLSPAPWFFLCSQFVLRVEVGKSCCIKEVWPNSRWSVVARGF
jgi:hypothetical protein